MPSKKRYRHGLQYTFLRGDSRADGLVYENQPLIVAVYRVKYYEMKSPEMLCETQTYVKLLES